jgi:cell division transport system ATP-binding protein
MIHFSQVTKEYHPGEPVLNEVDLRIHRGEFVYIVGRSGAGKSTFLKLIFALETPTSGSVSIGGCHTSTLRPKEVPFFRRKIGVVYQDFKLLPRRSVFENVAFALEIVGRPQWEIQERVRKVLTEVGLLHCANKRPAQLSGGEQQRVAIARALVREPWILLADEPTGNLDPDIANEIMKLFERAHQRGTTLIVATHDQELLRRESERDRRILRIQDGKVLEYQGKKAISSAPPDVVSSEPVDEARHPSDVVMEAPLPDLTMPQDEQRSD